MASKIANSQIVKLDNVSHELKDSLITIEKISGAMKEFLEKLS
jgi:hypothetical protein